MSPKKETLMVESEKVKHRRRGGGPLRYDGPSLFLAISIATQDFLQSNTGEVGNNPKKLDHLKDLVIIRPESKTSSISAEQLQLILIW